LQQQLGELLGRVGEAEALAGAVVEFVGGGVEHGFGDGGEVGALGEVLARQAVGVLVGAVLPGRVRVAEETSMPASPCTRFQSRISGPWSRLSERRSASGSVATLRASAGATCSGLWPSGNGTSIAKPVARSTSVPIAVALRLPINSSPSR
jgi:hypothetical protein